MGAAPNLVVIDLEQLQDLVRTTVREAVRAEVHPETGIMTREQVAEMLHCTDRTVVSYVEKEGLPASKLPNGWRFFRDEVVAWMKGRPVKKAKAE